MPSSSRRAARTAARTAALASSALLAVGVSVAGLGAPASAQPALERSRSCFDPHSVGAAARGAARALDHRDISAREVRAIEARTARILARKQAAAGALAVNSKARIPVYVHEMRAANGAGDVSPTQIRAQISVLNQTYSSSDVNEPAGSTAPDTGVRFVLAGSDEYLNNTWHHDRQSSTYRSRTRLGGKNALNIWLVDFVDDTLGIATFPWDYAGSPAIDGIRVQYNSLRPTSLPAPGYQAIPHFGQGESATNEAGHWLGLLHTFQGFCTALNDAVRDTPAQSSPTAGCPVGRNSCSLPGLDPIHNYMDYSFDSCYYEFSSGQASRIDEMWDAYRA